MRDTDVCGKIRDAGQVKVRAKFMDTIKSKMRAKCHARDCAAIGDTFFSEQISHRRDNYPCGMVLTDAGQIEMQDYIIDARKAIVKMQASYHTRDLLQ